MQMARKLGARMWRTNMIMGGSGTKRLSVLRHVFALGEEEEEKFGVFSELPPPTATAGMQSLVWWAD